MFELSRILCTNNFDQATMWYMHIKDCQILYNTSGISMTPFPMHPALFYTKWLGSIPPRV